MGLFDDLGKKISQTSHSIMSKASEMADVSKLNGQISEREKTLKNLYMQLGEAYYMQHSAAPEEDLVQWCQSIAAEKDQIADLKKQVVAARKMKICPKCGAECDQSLAFCGACGTELPKTEEKKTEEKSDTKFCASCGQAISAEAAFCPFCGNKS